MAGQEQPTGSGEGARILAVSVGRPRPIDRNGRSEDTAIWKTPVDGPVRAAGVNLEGDDQADRQAHGGHDKAIYAYADEDRRWWEGELGRPIEVAGFGENLTTVGIDLAAALVGERWRVGSVVLEVSEPRVPCWKLNRRLDDDRMISRFRAAGRPGTYLRILEEGVLAAGDGIAVIARPDHDLTVGEVARIHRDRDERGAKRLVGATDLSDAWRAWASAALDRG